MNRIKSSAQNNSTDDTIPRKVEGDEEGLICKSQPSDSNRTTEEGIVTVWEEIFLVTTYQLNIFKF